MARSFEEQYEELFGKKLTYDPIDINADDGIPSPRLDLTDEIDPTSSDPVDPFQSKLNSLRQDLYRTPRAAPPEDNAFGEDTLRRLGAGTAQTGAMAASALEYGSRQARQRVGGVGGEILDDVTAGIADLRRSMAGQAAEWRAGISPESLERQQRHILSLDPNQSVWRGSPTEVLDSLAGKVTEALPATVLTLLPAARWFRGGMTPAAVTYLGASEGVLSMGGVAQGIAEEIEQMTPEQLTQESPRYVELLNQLGNEEQARQQLIAEAQGAAPLIAGVVVGAISSTAGRYLEPVFQKGAGVMRRTGMGTGLEALQEAPQSGVEQYVQNVAAQVYDGQRPEWQGVAEATAEGAVVGGLTGGAFSAVFGGGPEDEAPSAPRPYTPPGDTRAPWFTPPPGRVSDTDDFGLEQPPGYVRGGGPSEVQLIEPGGVSPEIAAAMEAEGGQQRMFLPEQGELEQMGRQGGLTPMAQGPRREPVVRPPNALAVQPGTQQLPMRQRVRGGFQQPEGGEFPALQPNEPDMTSPTGRYEDPRQQTMFDQSFEGVPDEPGVEPLADLQAQLDDMETPGSERLGVYLSPANIEQLRNTQSLEPLLERGVVLANFDGKGGAMIARDREAGQELLDFRNTGAGNIQEVLGYATGAGVGKPAEGVTVQRRQKGAVVQESVVPEDQVDALVQQWETRFPNDEVAVLSVPAALGRRKRLLQQEQQKRVKKALIAEREQDVSRTREKVQKATAITPGKDAPKTLLTSRTTARRVAEGATSPTKAAARLLGQATRESAEPERMRIGGYFPPEALEFEDEREQLRYSARFRRLAGREFDIKVLDAKIKEIQDRKFQGRAREGFREHKKRFKEFKEKKNEELKPLLESRRREQDEKERLLDELHEIRTRAKPVRRAVHMVAAARRLSPETVEEAEAKARVRGQEPQEDDTTPPSQHIGLDELRKLTDTQIDNLEGDKLEDLFRKALTYITGRVKEHQEIYVGAHVTDESIAELATEVHRVVQGFWNPNDPGTEGRRGPPGKMKPVAGGTQFIPKGKTEPIKPRKARALDAYRLLEARYRSDSLKKRTITRARDIAMSRQYGGASKSKPITASSTSLKTRPDVHRRRGKFETQVLAAEFPEQDESVASKQKRKATAQRARERLEKTLRRSQAHLERLSSGKYEAMSQEKLGDQLTDRARALIHGRAYFRTIMDFAQAMVKSKNSSEDFVKEVEKVDEFLRNGIAMPVADFARVMGNLLHAEAQTQISEARVDEIKELADPEVREEKNADILDELLAAEASVFRLEEVWRKNPYYNSIVAPLIRKISDSRLRDGWPSYKPTEDEMLKLHWVMKNWSIPRLRKTFYTPLRHYFTTAGFQWTPTKKVRGEYVGGELVVPYVGGPNYARYKYRPSDRALRPLYVSKFGAERDTLGTTPVSKLTDDQLQALHEENVARGRLSKEQRFKPSPRYVKPSQLPGAIPGGRSRSPMETVGRLMQANRVIAKFRDLVAKPKLTIAGMIRTEERLVRAFKELGMWTQTGPLTGTVRFQNTSQAYRLVGPRLQSKELSKEEGRKILLQQMKPQPIAEDVYSTNVAAQRIANDPLSAESELFLETVADPGPAIEQFRKLALTINQRLDNTHQLHTLGEFLPMVLDAIPENHMFHNLAQKLMDSGIGDVPVSWDMRGQLDSKNLGRSLWDDDPKSPTGRMRYIILNRTGINGKREPGAALLHVLLHEATHMATVGALDRNPAVRQAFTMLKVMAARFMHNEGGVAWEKLPYGLKEMHDINEFVAEAYSNPKFQSLLKRIPYDYSMSLWGRFVEIVKDILGISSQRREPTNAFEAVMTLENHIFTGQDRLKGSVSRANVANYDRLTELQQMYEKAEDDWDALELLKEFGEEVDDNELAKARAWFNYLDRQISDLQDKMELSPGGSSSLNMLDDAVRPVAEAVLDRMNNVGETFKRGWSRSLAPNAPLIMMTMRQIHKEFRRHFGIGKNALDRYMENWERRNAENSRLMAQGEAVSREWTSATEKTSAQEAVEFSRIITEATLGGIHPDRAVSAKGNEHLKLEGAKARHAELAARFNRLSPAWKELYGRLMNYYQKTLEHETDLLMLNALRGTLATGDNAIMSRSDFDKKYTEETIRKRKLFTKEGLEAEFGTLDKAMLRTLQEIASIPQMREGPYFPLMRYGDYVVYARKQVEKRTFEKSKEAYEYRAKKLAEDPLLEVNVKKGEDDQYTVYVSEVDFRTRETATEAEQQKLQMIAEYGRENVTDVQLKRDFKTEDTIHSGSALAGILANLKGNGAAQSAIKNYWLRTLSDRSMRKHQIRRKNREGVDYDLQHRSFTNYVKQASYHISQLKFGWRMADAFRDIQAYVAGYRDTPEASNVRLGRVVQELEKRDEMTNHVDEMPKIIRTATELGQFFMLFGPSYWLINMTQPYMVTLPWLSARYGLIGAGAALKTAQSLILHPLVTAGKNSLGGFRALWSKAAAEEAFNVLDQVKERIKKRGGERASSYIDMLEQLRQQNVIDLSWVAELRDISEGRDTGPYQRFMDATRIMAHLTEVNNRIVTALAAYNLRYDEVMAKQGATAEVAHAAAVQTAKDAVAETQFDYSSGNKPRLFQTGGPLGRMAPLLFQFMQYSQHMYAMLISNFATAMRKGDVNREVAAKTLAGILTSHALAAGVLGATIQPIKWAIGLMLMAFGDDDEAYNVANMASGESFDRWARGGLSWALGNELGGVVAQGLPELAGVRLTNRMSLGTLYYLDLKTDTAESTLGSVAQGFLGPVLGYSFTGVAALKQALDGQKMRAVETLAPKAVRDVMRAWRYTGDGIVNNAGDEVLDAGNLNAGQLFLQAAGFQPSEIADMYAKQSYVKEIELEARGRRDALIARFRRAETISERNAVLKEAAAFSARNPAFAITRSSLLRALAGKAEREASYRRSGVALRGRSRLYGDRGSFYDEEE